MKNILYFTVFLYTFLIIVIGLTAPPDYTNAILADTFGDNVLFGINLFFRLLFLTLTAVFFIMSMYITNEQKKSGSKLTFYASQLGLSSLLAVALKFKIFTIFHINYSIIVVGILLFQVFAYFSWSDFQNLRRGIKMKAYTIIVLAIVFLISNALDRLEFEFVKIFAKLTLLWMDFLLMMIAWEIMYNKISKLKKISNRYYRDQSLRKQENSI